MTVTGGYGYGVIGADIHVFGDGTPVYLLENYRPAPPPESGWLRELPSRMLQARYAVVPFTGREAELASLAEWSGGGPRLAVRWLHGPGGAGKTRLAEEFARRSLAAGWKVLTAVHGPSSVLPAPGSQDLRADGHPGLLLVVDYADRWPLSHLTWLLSNALLHRSQTPTRVLLLARGADAWPAVRAGLARHRAGTSGQRLAPLDGRGGARAAMFTAARDGFAVHYGVADAGTVGPPGPLDDPRLGLVLALQMAALVAVDAHAAGRNPPADPAGLTVYLLDREVLHWHQLYGDGTGRLGTAAAQYATPPGTMNRTVFAAALTGPLAPGAAAAALAPLRLVPDTARLLADHALCYPPGDPDRPSALEPLYPDRLAEDFLALTVPGHRADYPAQPWAAATAAALLTDLPAAGAHGDGPGPAEAPGPAGTPSPAEAPGPAGAPSPVVRPAPPEWTPRAVTMLAAAAERWPHVGPAQLHPLLGADPALAVAAGSAALVALAGPADVPVELLVAIAGHFPHGRDADLDVGIARVTQRLAAHLLPLLTDPRERSALLDELGRRLTNAGLRREALDAMRESVALRRSLAAADPGGELPGLAGALHRLGTGQLAVGAREAAAAATAEALALERRLLADSAIEPEDLAATVNNLAVHLSALGRHAEALAAAEEAVALVRRAAAEGRPSDGLPTALDTLGTALWRTGRRDEAVAVGAEAVAAHRESADGDPAELAGSLANHANQLSEGGRWEEAQAAAEEATTVLRGLAARNPDAFGEPFALALQSLAIALGKLGRRTEALAAVGEAVGIHRRLARSLPAVAEPPLAVALNSLGLRLHELGDWSGALAAAEESVAIQRRLYAGHPAAFEDSLATAVNNLGGRLMKAGRFTAAVTAAEEAVTIRRRMADADPETYRPGLALALLGLANRLNGGDLTAAAAVNEEAVGLLRGLAERDFAAFGPHLAVALGNLGYQYALLGRRAQSLAATEEAVRTRRRMAADRPASFEPGLAAALAKHGIALAAAGDLAAGLAATEEALALRRRQAQAEPAAFERDLAATLMYCAHLRAEDGRPADALAAAEEALALYLRLAAESPGVFDDLVAGTGPVVAELLEELGRRPEADAVRLRLGLRRPGAVARLVGRLAGRGLEWLARYE